MQPFLKNNFFHCLVFLLTVLPSCFETKKLKPANSEFQIELSPFSTIIDMEVGEKNIFILTNKHEVLGFDTNGTNILDTVFSPPRLYPNGAVEVYINNTFQSIFYHENLLYFLGSNPSDIIKFNLGTKKFSKQNLNMSEKGLHHVIGSNLNDLIVEFRNPQKGIFQIFKVIFPSLETVKLDEFTKVSSQNKFVSFSHNDTIFIFSALENGLFKYYKKDFIKVPEIFFLDSILYKGNIKGIMDLSEYASLEPWQRNQYQSDKILSAIQISDQESFYLLKLLNRTDPDSPESSIVLFKKSGETIIRKILEGYQFAKLDPETEAFLGFTLNNEVVVISDLASLIQ
ncbi:hypothetical protein [Algoriphagus algorifonticola]|uniref:hypothetical protein n=1 Tax=Algoriphagus algorifonticola TaxID=2593007 RepID=UPI0011A1F817|nr:hypothetical protein [Algoriphagus algorifonticola]